VLVVPVLLCLSEIYSNALLVLVVLVQLCLSEIYSNALLVLVVPVELCLSEIYSNALLVNNSLCSLKMRINTAETCLSKNTEVCIT
jgi:hypothetical protein